MLFDTLVENCIVTLGWKMKFIGSCKTSKGNDIDLNYLGGGGDFPQGPNAGNLFS